MEYKLDELLVLVKELTDSYTSKESTSIPYEVAQQLMGAVLYCIQENDLECADSDRNEMIEINRRHFPTAREAYENGYRLMIEKIRKANEIYTDMITDFKDYGNRAYYDTVVKGIPEFFKWYDPRLNPMNHIILVDYTVMDDQLYDTEGVDLIYRYLRCIRLEQKFLQRIPEGYIREVLIRDHSDYEELFINVCGVVLKRILINMLIGVKLEKIVYEETDYEKVVEIVNSTDKEELVTRFRSLLESLIKNLYDGDLDLYQYLSMGIVDITTQIRNAVHNQSIVHII